MNSVSLDNTCIVCIQCDYVVCMQKKTFTSILKREANNSFYDDDILKLCKHLKNHNLDTQFTKKNLLFSRVTDLNAEFGLRIRIRILTRKMIIRIQILQKQQSGSNCQKNDNPETH